MIEAEKLARKWAAEKMGLVKDPDGLRPPDDLWRQMLPGAEAYLEELAFELHAATVTSQHSPPTENTGK